MSYELQITILQLVVGSVVGIATALGALRVLAARIDALERWRHEHQLRHGEIPPTPLRPRR